MYLISLRGFLIQIALEHTASNDTEIASIGYDTACSAIASNLKVLQDRLGHKPNFVLNPLMMIEGLDIDLPSNLSMPFIFTSQNAVTFTMQKQASGVEYIVLALKFQN